MRYGYRVFGLGLFAIGCGHDEPLVAPRAADPAESTVTYQKDIRPLIESSCLSCHVDGGIAPFALDSPASVAELRDLVVGAVVERIMPPWPASRDCRDLRDTRALSDDQIALFEDWRRVGFPDGDEKDYTPPERTSGPKLGEPTRILAPRASYVPNAAIADEIRCFMTEGTFEQDSYVTAMDIRPGVRAQVHHAQVHKVSVEQLDAVRALDDAAPGEGYPCPTGAGAGIRSVNMFSWRLGSEAVSFESGDAALIDAGSAIILQVHYNNQFLPPGTTPEPDQSSVAFWTLPAGVTPSRVVVRAGQFGPVGPSSSGFIFGGTIPAGEPHVVGESRQTLDSLSRVAGQFVAGEVIGMTPHMHTLGTRLSATLTRADGAEVCMIDVPNWDFEWQLDYSYATPETYVSADVLTVRCEYDNSPGNQPYLNGQRLQPRTVTWGEGSLDEMCLNYVWFRYDWAAFQAARGPG